MAELHPHLIQEDNTQTPRINIDYLTLRKYLGILGIALPIMLIIGNDFVIEESISHYYYTEMTVVFTGTLVAFGLFLISYKGYPLKKGELLSDNVITNLAGVFAFVVAIIPTACDYCTEGVPNGHDDILGNTIHLVSAGLFMVCMGYMAFIQFVKSDDTDPCTKRRKRIWRFSGIVIWVVVLFLLAEFLFNFQLTPHDTFLGETVALLFFGVAWLIKSKTLERIGL